MISTKPSVCPKRGGLCLASLFFEGKGPALYGTPQSHGAVRWKKKGGATLRPLKPRKSEAESARKRVKKSGFTRLGSDYPRHFGGL